MSGKAPPRGPRALLGSLAAGSVGASATATGQPPSSPSPSNTRIGAAPPTGPRSLLNGSFHAGPRGPKPKLFHNGSPIPTGPAGGLPPVRPHGFQIKYKGKQPEISRPESNGPSHLNVLNESSNSPSSSRVSVNGDSGRTSPAVQPRPPSQPPPSIEPAPPPPPSSAPPRPPSPPRSPCPPPPPPSSPPPVFSLSRPPSPPKDSPPPPPPPTSLPPPPPPTSLPPPPPPTSSPPPPPPTSSLPLPPPPPPPVSLPPPPPRSPPPPPPSPPPPSPRASSSQLLPVPPPILPPPTTALSPPKVYSLPPPPSWPPAQSEYPPGKNFKVVYDEAYEAGLDARYCSVLEAIRRSDEQRVKGKGKPIIFRFGGEVVDGEPEAVIRDPRKVPGLKKLSGFRTGRGTLYELKYEYDPNSTGPPPPTAVLVTNLSPLTSSHQIRRYFNTHGHIVSFEPQVDKETGGTLGIVFVKYLTHEEAKRCVERENGKKLGAAGLNRGLAGVDDEEMRVVFDGERKRLDAVIKELDERKRKDREERKRKEKEAKMKVANAANLPPVPTPSSNGQTPDSRKPNPLPQPPHLRNPPPSILNGRPHHLPPIPLPPPSNNDQLNSLASAASSSSSRIRRPPPSLVRARIMTETPKAVPMASPVHYPNFPSSRPGLSPMSSSSTPIHTRGRFSRFRRDSPSRSRSPSPILRRPGHSSQGARQKEREAVIQELAKNGFNHLKLEGAHLGGSAREEDVRKLFEGFKVGQILRDHTGWYVTFLTMDSAARAAMVLNSGARTLAHNPVSATVHPPPTAPTIKTHWSDDELVYQAQQVIIKELTKMLEKDVMERVVGVNLRAFAAEQKKTNDSVVKNVIETGQKSLEKRSLQGLSFRKPNKRSREEVMATSQPQTPLSESAVQLPEDDGEEERKVVAERPKKKRKKESVKKPKKIVEDIESEDDDSLTLQLVPDIIRKRAVSGDSDVDEPERKKIKSDVVYFEPRLSKLKSTEETEIVEEHVDEVLLPEDFEPPDVASVHVSSGPEFSPSPQPSLREPKYRSPSPPPGPPVQEVCDDDEDFYFVKLALSGLPFSSPQTFEPESKTTSGLDSAPTIAFRKHLTGSARTEGYYKISHAEKSAYVAQYALRASNSESAAQSETPQPQHVSSRSNRANARRRAQGLEEINQVQRAVALSKGETGAAELSIKFNQLQTRKKHLRFARSPIHDWGLYAMERISRGEMVIEYVGEIIRAAVADKREKAYERQGIGSSYLFRIDEDLVVDATKKGNLGRLINHCCDPNCTAKIITINGEKKIVIYAKQDIELGDEITYDYHFPIEQDKIPCLCGSAKCRGYLN